MNMGIRSHIRSNVIGYIALFLVVTGGTAEALNGSNTVFTDDIVNGQVKNPDLGTGAVAGPKLAANAVGSAKVVDGSLTGADVDESKLYAETRIVSPVGTALENGQALRGTVNAITDASSTKPYLVKVEPGEYDVGGTPLHLPSFVDLEGSGSNLTKLDSSVSGTNALLVIGASHGVVKDLTIAGGANAMAISVQSDLTLEDDLVTASGTSSQVFAIVVANGAHLDVQDSRVSSAVGGSGITAYGIDTEGSAASLSVYDSLIKATASGPGDFASALSVNGPSADVRASSLVGAGTAAFAVIDNGTNSTVTIDASTVQGSQKAAGAGAGDKILIGASKVIGGHDSGAAGTVTCVFSYKDTYVATNATCD
jgi:hypothetical protein